MTNSGVQLNPRLAHSAVPTPDARRRIEVEGLAKSFVLHAQGGVAIPVIEGAAFTVSSGECLALTGASGAGKSTLLRMLYGNYRIPQGAIRIRRASSGPGAPAGLAARAKLDDDWTDLATASDHEILELRRVSLGFVSQFLRVIPRVSALELVAEPLLAAEGRDGDGWKANRARERAMALLARLRLPERLWPLSPLTFSGGEQQRVNIARGLAYGFPTLLLDEPTASLDAANRETVLEMIEEARNRGAALVGIFHDDAARERLCTREISVEDFQRDP